MGWIKDIFEGIVDEGYDKLCDIGVCDRTAITYDSNGGRRSIADRIIDPYYEREANIRRAEANEKEARKMEKFSESVYENARANYNEISTEAKENYNKLSDLKKKICDEQMRVFISYYNELNESSVFNDKKIDFIDIDKNNLSMKSSYGKSMFVEAIESKFRESKVGEILYLWDSEENLERAHRYCESVDEMSKDLFRQNNLLKEINCLCEDNYFALCELSKQFEPLLREFKRSIDSLKYTGNVRYEYLSQKQRMNLQKCMLFAQTISNILNTDIINTSGEINQNNKALIFDAENILNIKITRG